MTERCPRCGGTGRVWAEIARLGSVVRRQVRCMVCRGSGRAKPQPKW